MSRAETELSERVRDLVDRLNWRGWNGPVRGHEGENVLGCSAWGLGQPDGHRADDSGDAAAAGGHGDAGSDGGDGRSG